MIIDRSLSEGISEGPTRQKDSTFWMASYSSPENVIRQGAV